MLTDEEIKKLGGHLHGTMLNAYTEASSLFHKELTDEDFKRLENIGQMFKCEECDEWLTVDQKDSDDLCISCAE